MLKGIGCWLGAFVWIVVVVRAVPDNRTGATVLIGPTSALMLAGTFYLFRFAGALSRSWTTAIMTVTAVPVGRPISGSPASQEIPARSDESSQSDRVDIAANVGKIALRLIGGTAALLIFAQVLGGTSYDTLLRSILYVAAIVIGAFALRSFLSRGPAISLASVATAALKRGRASATASPIPLVAPVTSAT